MLPGFNKTARVHPTGYPTWGLGSAEIPIVTPVKPLKSTKKTATVDIGALFTGRPRI